MMRVIQENLCKGVTQKEKHTRRPIKYIQMSNIKQKVLIEEQKVSWQS